MGSRDIESGRKERRKKAVKELMLEKDKFKGSGDVESGKEEKQRAPAFRQENSVDKMLDGRRS